VKWIVSVPAEGVEGSKFCLFTVVLPARCVSTISPRFHYRRHTFCFLPLATILESSTPPQSNEPIEKWATELNRNFSKEEVQMTKKKKKTQQHEKIFTIPDHKGNANQNHTKIPLTFFRIASIKNTTSNKCW
jgi:hypothetical protein